MQNEMLLASFSRSKLQVCHLQNIVPFTFEVLSMIILRTGLMSLDNPHARGNGLQIWLRTRACLTSASLGFTHSAKDLVPSQKS